MEFLQRLTSGRQRPTAAIDLAVARGSLVIEAIAYVFMALASTGSLFTVFAVVSTLGIAFTPAINTVASAVYTQQGGKELGKLFGALGVVQTIWCVSLLCYSRCVPGKIHRVGSSLVLGPFIFGMTYMRTVKTAPKSIFVVTVAALMLSFITLAPIRLQHHHSTGADGEGGASPDSDSEQAREADESAPLISEGTHRRKSGQASYTES